MGKTYEKLVIDSLEVDPTYQRDFVPSRAKAMSVKLDWARFGVPVVSRRADGKCYVIDAQHRVAAAKIAGEGSRSVMCEVHCGLTMPDEAGLFLDLNAGRKAVSAFDRYRARMVNKEPIAVAFTEVVESCGLKIAQTGKRNVVVAVQAVEFAHRRNHNLAETLTLLRAWGGGDIEAFDGQFIKDFSCFLYDYRDTLDIESLTVKLGKVTAPLLARRIKTHQENLGVRRAAANQALREIYNVRKSAAGRLKPTLAELGITADDVRRVSAAAN